MLTPNARFLELLQDIEPSSTTVGHAVSAHTSMRDFIANHREYKSYHVRTFLSGSYRRATAIRPRIQNGVLTRPDVDIIVVTNHTLDDCPKGVVEQLYDVIVDGYENIRLQQRSVGVETSNVDMDVVPIIEPYGDGNGLYIPDRALKTWLATNPPGHTEWTREVNASADGRFKPLVKLLKWWRRHNPTTGRHPKGFMIECIAAACMDYTETHYGELFAKTLEGIVARYTVEMTLGLVPVIPDPGVPTNCVTSSVAYEDFRSFYDLAVEHAHLARQALEVDDVAEMTRIWRIIFGNRFPETQAPASKGLLAAPAVVPAHQLVFPDRAVAPNKPAGFA